MHIIKHLRYDRRGVYKPKMPWPENNWWMQCGQRLPRITRTPRYFFEIFPDERRDGVLYEIGAGYYRGEGDSIEEAEAECFKNYRADLEGSDER